MKIIAISGGSGTGKSTISQNLSQILPNSATIHVDPIMHAVDAKMEKEILEAIKPNIQEGVHPFNYYFESYKNVQTWCNMIKNPVNDMIEETIKKYHDKDYVIIDWAFMQWCDIFNKCDYTICMKADQEIAQERLIKRLKSLDKDDIKSYWAFQDWALKNRVDFTAIDKRGYKCEYQIVNNGTLEELSNNVKKFVNGVISGESTSVNKFFKFK